MSYRYEYIFLFVTITIICAGAVVGQVPYNKNQFWESTENGVYSTGMIWRDINNDGYIDLLISNGNDMNKAANCVYISDHGILPTSATWSSINHEYTGHCAVGDINDDGWADFLVANLLGADGFATPNIANMYLNTNGSLSTSPTWYSSDSAYTFSCALGDADCDGDLDLVLATGEPYGNVDMRDRIYFNNNGVLETTPGWMSDDATEALDVTWGDVDNDGDLDLAFAYNDRPPAVYENVSCIVNTVPMWEADDNESSNTVIFGDVNNDGWLDLIVAFNYQLGGYGYFRVYFNDGTGNLSTVAGWQSGDGGYGSAVTLYDYDNDGYLDLSAGRWWDRTRIYHNLGGTFSTFPQWQANPSTVVEELAFVDVDGAGNELRADTITAVSDKHVFYTRFVPLASIDSVFVDGIMLDDGDYCFDLVSGWVTVGQPPTNSIIIHYQYSFVCDLAVANWDVHNMAFANTSPVPVTFTADKTFGFAPLDVQFTDNGSIVSDRLWTFGDGQTTGTDDPLHTYTSGGIFDVYLEGILSDGWHNHMERSMIIVLADTLRLPDVISDNNDSLIIPITLTTAHPLDRFTIPIALTGPMELTYTGFDTEGCRTDGLADITVISETDPLRLAFIFDMDVESGGAPLIPDTGKIINIHFEIVSRIGSGVIDTTTVASNSLYLDANYVQYQPYVIPGSFSPGYACGDANGDGEVNVGDAVHLINYVFKGGAAPEPLEAGDANCDLGVNVADAVYVISYVFKGGPAPCCP